MSYQNSIKRHLPMIKTSFYFSRISRSSTNNQLRSYSTPLIQKSINLYTQRESVGTKMIRSVLSFCPLTPKFLSKVFKSLFNLRSVAAYKDVIIKHDLTPNQRDTIKALKVKCNNMNSKLVGTDFIWGISHSNSNPKIVKYKKNSLQSSPKPNSPNE